MATEMAVGLAIAQQMMQQQGGVLAGGAGGATTATAEMLTPAQVAQALGVSEPDVLALIRSGELKAKQIGSSFRVKRSALDAYRAD
jgi:excisionase family DNA binding protein